jgi:hypothetical protein
MWAVQATATPQGTDHQTEETDVDEGVTEESMIKSLKIDETCKAIVKAIDVGALLPKYEISSLTTFCGCSLTQLRKLVGILKMPAGVNNMKPCVVIALTLKRWWATSATQAVDLFKKIML